MSTEMSTELTEWTPQAIKALRLAMRLSQDELARKIGTTQETVCRWESGASRPKYYRMKRALDRLASRLPQ